MPSPPVWFITGCSSGFGAALALHALHSGHSVIATSRSPSSTPHLVGQIESLGGTFLALDVCDPSATVHAVLEGALRIHGHIDVLVNNAGISLLGAVEDISEEETRHVMETNFFAPLRIVRFFLKGMRERRSGTVVSVSSTAGQVALPAVGVYAASKHALEAITESLSHELRPLGIRVLIIQPGGFNTSFASRIQSPAAPMTPDYASTPVAKVMNSISTLAGNQFGDVEKGARAIFDVVMGTGVAEGLGEASGKGEEEEQEKKGEDGGKEGKGRGVIGGGYLRIPLGSDCAMRLKGQYDTFQKGLEGTRQVWESTDLDRGEEKGEGQGEKTMLDFGR